MASLSTDKNGNRSIQFIAADKQRRSIRLGKMSLKAAREIKTKVEALNMAQTAQLSVEPEVAVWIRQISEKSPVLYDKLAAVKLLPKREAAKAVTLGAFLQDYVSSRTDVKATTITVYGHTKRCLLEFFGADRLLSDITAAEADEWRRFLSLPATSSVHGHAGQGLSSNTVRRRCGIAKQFFRYALRRRLIDESPFADMKGIAVQRNKSRMYFVTLEDAYRVLAACTDAEWRVQYALARFGGFRCPSESVELRWTDINWETNRILIRSPKTEHHGEAHASREIPIFPRLRPYLEALRDKVRPGVEVPLTTPVITAFRQSEAYLRAKLKRTLKRAGLKVYPKLWQNLRSTCQTELADVLPPHVVCRFMGNSERVAERHYLQVNDHHFELACSALQIPVHSGTARDVTELHGEIDDAENAGKNATSNDLAMTTVGDTGLEPVTSAV